MAAVPIYIHDSCTEIAQLITRPHPARQRNLKTVSSFSKRIKCFPLTLRKKNLNTQRSAIILDLSLRKARPRKSQDHHNVIVFDRFPSTVEHKDGVFIFLWFEEPFGNVFVTNYCRR